MSSTLISFVGWTFLPNLVTGWLQSFYYGVTIRAGDPKPQPGTPRWHKHRRRIHIGVILAYLLYTFFEADYEVQQAGDFYQVLGVAHSIDERGIKSRFRRLAALHHPDKVGGSEDQAATEAFFVHLKLAQDILVSPTKRFAYDRFGPKMLEWQHCSSIRDYLLVGLQAAAPKYLGSMVVLIILSVTGYLQWGRFWRYLTSVSLLLLEVTTLSRPHHPHFLTTTINPLLSTLTTHPPLLPFQLLIIARRATLTVFIALSQLGPLFQPLNLTSASSHPHNIALPQLARLEQMSHANDQEATRLLGLDMAPFAGDEPAQKELSVKIRDWLVQNTIRADPEVRNSIGKALGKRRAGAPPGAKA